MLRTLLLLSLIPVAAVAQTDYVITTKADTLRGEVRLLSYDKIDRVQVTVGKKKEMLTALQVLTVFYKDNLYKPIQYDNRVVLMQQLKTGYLSLYAFQLPNQTSYDGRYLYRLDGRHIEVPNLAFKKIMGEYLQDCQKVSDEIKSGNLGKKELEQILGLYNACKESVKSAEPVAPPVVSEQVIAIQNLKKKVAELEFASKKDALDILSDLEQKAGRNETIPNYLLEGLKSYLAPATAAHAELEKVLQLLKK